MIYSNYPHHYVTLAMIVGLVVMILNWVSRPAYSLINLLVQNKYTITEVNPNLICSSNFRFDPSFQPHISAAHISVPKKEEKFKCF